MSRQMPCPKCGKLRIASFPRLCRECHQAEQRKLLAIQTSCALCGIPVTLTSKRQKDQFRESRLAYCSPEHMREYCRRLSSDTMARTNRKYASKRMKERNPMSNPEIRARAKATKLAQGNWKPPVQGGNGRETPRPQAMLAEALGWPVEFVVCTKMRRGSGYPYHYKLDIADPEHMISIEVDGASHNSPTRRTLDEKKDAFLAGLGWIVLRFSNREVTEHLEACVQTVQSTISKSSNSTHTLQKAS